MSGLVGVVNFVSVITDPFSLKLWEVFFCRWALFCDVYGGPSL